MQIGRVYSIRSHLRPDLVYYGSTKQTLACRLAEHTRRCKYFRAGKSSSFYTSFIIIELGDAYIEIVERVQFSEKSQLRAVEGRHIRENDCVNKYVPGRSSVESYAAHYDQHKAKYAVRNAKYHA